MYTYCALHKYYRLVIMSQEYVGNDNFITSAFDIGKLNEFSPHSYDREKFELN